MRTGVEGVGPPTIRFFLAREGVRAAADVGGGDAPLDAARETEGGGAVSESGGQTDGRESGDERKSRVTRA